MTVWPNNPVIYEINTWVWLSELSQQYGRHLTLGNVPPEEWAALAKLGLDAVWFMGIWERSPEGVRISSDHVGLQHEFRAALPDFIPADNLGSAYCVRRFEVDERLGGKAGLATARQELAVRGIRVILDFVPNHVARDHPWVLDHPEYFIQGTRREMLASPREFFESAGRVIAFGKDPNFPAWEDVAQVDAFNSGYRQAAMYTLAEIASQCDGVRCDMAMLLLDRIFNPLWGKRTTPPLAQGFWNQVIPATLKFNPDFIFIAEAYWGTRLDLLQAGFSYCYDKELYDLLLKADAATIEKQVQTDSSTPGVVRFIENHDELRATSVFLEDKARAAAVILSTLPGACLYHQGQFEGRRLRLPVFLRRWMDEPTNLKMEQLYHMLVPLAALPMRKHGNWRMCMHHGWPDNQTHASLLCWTWHHHDEILLTVVNYSPRPAQGLVTLPWAAPGHGDWLIEDLIKGDSNYRSSADLFMHGYFVDLPGWGFHLLRCTPD
ncbi:MAG: alpha-amylase [Anaerolinea sp.]|nr:alpha-amylase [Anaerolinea sp.]